jgi:hypothetical protein
MKPDEVCQKYADLDVDLEISAIPQEDIEDLPMIHIGGSPISLKFLGELLIAVSAGGDGEKKQIFPNGPGGIFFGNSSKFGLYLERKSDSSA